MMNDREAIKWLENLIADIGKTRHEALWHYAQALDEIVSTLEEREERSKGCAKCSTEKEAGMPLSNEQIYKMLNPSHKFCAYCGRPLKGESNEE